MEVDKTRFKDEKGRYIVQGLFIEDRYNTDLAVYTMAGEDKEYKGQVFPSLKKLYLEAMDPEEYIFASTYLYDWPHWQRLCNNNIVGREIAKWRDELILSIRSEAINSIIHMATEKDSYQAAKWLADEGWTKKTRGRPSKEELEERITRDAQLSKEFEDDVAMLHDYRGKKNG